MSATDAKVPPRGIAPNVDFVLTRESVLEGRVTDAAGKPVEDAEVRVDVPGEGMMRMAAQFMGGIFRSGRSGSDGTYRVTGLPATFWIAPDGTIVKRLFGVVTRESLEADLALFE